MLVIKLRWQGFGIDVWRKFWSWGLVEFLIGIVAELLKLNFGQDFEAKVWSSFDIEVWSRFGWDCCWKLIDVTLAGEDGYSILIDGLTVAMLKSSNAMMAEVWFRLEIWDWSLVEIFKLNFGHIFSWKQSLWWKHSTLSFVAPLAMSWILKTLCVWEELVGGLLRLFHGDGQS